MALSIRGCRLAEHARFDDALASTAEAVELWREACKESPQRFLPHLSSSLNDLSTRLAQLGRTEQAVVVAREAADMGERLANIDPAAYRSSWASCLNNLSNRLAEAGKSVDALAAIRQAMSIYRQLSAQEDPIYLPFLASSLCNLGACLSDAGDLVAAVDALTESVSIYASLRQRNPRKWPKEHCQALLGLGLQKAALGQRSESFGLAVQARDIALELAKNEPRSGLLLYARTLDFLADRTEEQGELSKASELRGESLRCYQQLDVTDRDVLLPRIAAALSSAAPRLAASGKGSAALEVAESAVGLYRGMQTDDETHGRYAAELASALLKYSEVLWASGRSVDSTRAAAECVRILRRSKGLDDLTHRRGLVSALSLLARRYVDLGRQDEALNALAEVVQNERLLAVQRPDVFRSGLRDSLGAIEPILRDVGRAEDALVVRRQVQELMPKPAHGVTQG
jgi:hypothetical protein